MGGKRRRVDELDPAVKPAGKGRKKSDRTEDENTERAYIAASRRSDRSMEARIQSARAASLVHKKRTGKALKITEEIVRKEEMYEEEDDDLPRQYRALAAHLHTSSPMMNNRANAWLTSQIAAAAYAQEVEAEFAKHFPNAPIVSRRLQGMYSQSLPQDPSPALQSYQPGPHLGSPTPPPPMGYHPRHRSQSVPQIATQPQMFAQFDHQSPMSGQYESVDDALPALTPTSNNADTPNSSCTPPVFHTNNLGSRGQPTATLPVDSSLGASNATFPLSFTSEIPNNIKDMANMDPLDQMSPLYMGFVGGELAGSDTAMWPTFFAPPSDILSSEYEPVPAASFEPSHVGGAPQSIHDASQPICNASQHIGEDLLSIQQGGRIDTPDPNTANDSWKSWLADYEEGDSEI